MSLWPVIPDPRSPIPSLLADGHAHEAAYGAECRLRRVEPEQEILVGVGGEKIGRLVPLGIPAAADVRATLVLAQADRCHFVHEWRRVGVGHVRTDRGR